MKNKTISILLAAVIFASATNRAIANNYSPRAIQIYNLGASYQSAGKNELAEKQYNMALSLQPDMVEAKNNLYTIYANRTDSQYNNGDYFNALTSARKSLQYKPNDFSMYMVIGNSYEKLKRYDEALKAFQKAQSLNSCNTDALQALGEIYLLQQKYESAAPIYKKLLAINPNDRIALQNVKYLERKMQDKSLNNSLNTNRTPTKAPATVYNLIKPSAGVPPYTVEQTKAMLDLIWSDSTGQILISNLIKNRIPINLTYQMAMNANATQTKKSNTFALYGLIPIYTYNRQTVEVNIPYKYVENFNNKNLSPYQRIYCLHVLVHEFCHAYRATNFPELNNSLEEELSASMIGLNVSYKVINGCYLSQKQTQMYSMELLKSLLSDDHKTLQTFSGFTSRVQEKGILLPYPEIYEDIPMMRRKLINGEDLQ